MFAGFLVTDCNIERQTLEIMNNYQQQQQRSNSIHRQQNCLVYTYHLPYGVRKDICDLLDADQSWRTLAGQYIGLDATQIALISQAYMRNGSPSNELLSRLDAENFRIAELCFYLQQMNHCRALEILKAFFIERGNLNELYGTNSSNNQIIGQEISTNACNTTVEELKNIKPRAASLNTPTPSFADLERGPAAIMCAFNQHNLAQTPSENNFSFNYLAESSDSPQQIKTGATGLIRLEDEHPTTPYVPHRTVANNKCHRTAGGGQQDLIGATSGDKQAPIGGEKASLALDDPGEEIVRMACANNRKRTSISDQEVVNQLRLIMQINYNELKQASNNFSDTNILGNGGFASVYRGHWKGTDVAIKRLKCNLMDQALNELTILNSYRIDNILPIYGISIDGPEACLVYQFMANGSLEDRLSCKRNTKPLTWTQRASIGEGVAKGLYYLHTLRDKPLVHGDVKSANVLLDSQYEPKLGDFGLARQVFKGKNPQTELCTHCTVSSIHGTSVYLPPEYLRHKILSPAVDVYSYGIVLLEMATGRRAYDGKRLLIEVVDEETRSIERGQIGYILKDPRLADDSQNNLRIWFELLIKLGLSCAHKIKKKRPDMGQVLARFADFKNSSSSSNNNNNINSGQIMDNLVATHPITSNGSTLKAETMDALNNGNFHQQEASPIKFGTNSQALMSVEEESEMQMINNKLQQDGQTAREQQEQLAKADAVDAMIPLLTELGLQQGS